MLGRCFSLKAKPKTNKESIKVKKPAHANSADDKKLLLEPNIDSLMMPVFNKSSGLSIALMDYPRLGSIYNEKLDFNNFRLVPFLDQDIQVIRSKKQPFDDSYFLKYIDSIVENPESLLFVSLKSRLGSAADLTELNKLIKWERTKVR
jgi:hypothetical protein